MTSDCTRWIAIADREAVGEPVSDEDIRFRRLHESTCASCAAEAASWKEIEESSIELPVGSAELNAMLERIAPQPPMWKPQRRSRFVGIAAVFSLATSVALLWVAVSRKGSPSFEKASVQVVVASGTLLAKGSGQLSAGTNVGEGTDIDARDETACLRIDPGVRACLARGSHARITSTALSDRRIELLTGRIAVSLEPQPKGSGFMIVTRAGTVSAIGTEFSVEVGETVKVAVLKGVVLVQGNDGRDERLPAHRTLLLGGGPADLDPREEQQIAEFLGGAPSVTVREPDDPPRVDREPASPIASSLARPGRSADKATGESMEPADLLQQARDERARGRFGQAADLYRKLQTSAPDSAEARVALVSLGDLQLSHLGDPAGALRSFDSYLRAGGGLSQEAWYGKIRALRELGRTSEEKQAIERFLAAYPSAVQASTLRARLAELR